ncbi:MAG: hypothetical protein KDD82_09790, partial [Planctomycetes bacterium]|nr:hypothetical protein [Planctomycetota bacterium]
MSRALLLLLAPLCGCQTLTVEHRAPELRLRAPLRVAVLPFADRADGDFGLAVPLGAMMDVVPLMSDDAYARANGPRIFRDKLIANLRLAPLEVLPPQVVDAQLAAMTPPRTEVQATDRRSVAQQVGSALGVDLVVFGEVSEWDRNYVLLASWVSAGLAVEVRDGRSGELLFGGEVSDTETA